MSDEEMHEPPARRKRGRPHDPSPDPDVKRGRPRRETEPDSAQEEYQPDSAELSVKKKRGRPPKSAYAVKEDE